MVRATCRYTSSIDNIQGIFNIHIKTSRYKNYTNHYMVDIIYVPPSNYNRSQVKVTHWHYIFQMKFWLEICFLWFLPDWPPASPEQYSRVGKGELQMYFSFIHVLLHSLSKIRYSENTQFPFHHFHHCRIFAGLLPLIKYCSTDIWATEKQDIWGCYWRGEAQVLLPSTYLSQWLWMPWRCESQPACN